MACGYSQIPGVDFSENYSPVVHDITFRLLLVLKIVYGFRAKVADINTAFVWGDLEEAIFMDCPKGLQAAKPTDALVLKKSIYGLVQVA